MKTNKTRKLCYIKTWRACWTQYWQLLPNSFHTNTKTLQCKLTWFFKSTAEIKKNNYNLHTVLGCAKLFLFLSFFSKLSKKKRLLKPWNKNVTFLTWDSTGQRRELIWWWSNHKKQEKAEWHQRVKSKTCRTAQLEPWEHFSNKKDEIND